MKKDVDKDLQLVHDLLVLTLFIFGHAFNTVVVSPPQAQTEKNEKKTSR